MFHRLSGGKFETAKFVYLWNTGPRQPSGMLCERRCHLTGSGPTNGRGDAITGQPSVTNGSNSVEELPTIRQTQVVLGEFVSS